MTKHGHSFSFTIIKRNNEVVFLMLIVNVFIDSLNTNSLVAFLLCKANDIVFYILIFKVCILLVCFFFVSICHLLGGFLATWGQLN